MMGQEDERFTMMYVCRKGKLTRKENLLVGMALDLLLGNLSVGLGRVRL
jgi:hypothetical protein